MVEPPESTSPEIAVVIPVLNAVHTLEQQVTAVLSQECPVPFEVLLADNGSVDGTTSIYHRLSYPVRVIDARSAPLGGAGAKNAGVLAAQAPLIAFCDADDQVEPGWLAAIYHGLQQADVVTVRRGYWELNPRLRRILPEYSGNQTIEGVPQLSGGAFGIRRQLYLDVGCFDEEFKGAVDTEFGGRLFAHTGKEPLAVDAAVQVRTPQSPMAWFRRERLLSRSKPMLRPGVQINLRRRVLSLIKYSPVLLTRRRILWMRNLGRLVGEMEGVRQR